MSKYTLLWEYIARQPDEKLILSFDQLCEISGVKIDHSFLNFKKELLEYGWHVDKISMNGQTVLFKKDE